MICSRVRCELYPVSMPEKASGIHKEPGVRDVVLVGAGHTHIFVFPDFAADPPPRCRVTVVVDTPIAVYSGMAPGYVAGQYRREELEIDVRPLAELIDATVIVDRAVGIDAHNNQVKLASGDTVRYDFVSLDIGSTVTGLDVPGVREHAIATRPITKLIERVDDLLDRAQAKVGEPFNVIIAGGGAGGVELAFTLHHRLSAHSSAAVHVTLLEAGTRILARYPVKLARRVLRLAARQGINIVCERRVGAVSGDRVELNDGGSLACDALIWVTGATSHGVFDDSGLDADERGFLHTRTTLQARDHDNIFAAGDCATMLDYPTTAKAGVYAVRQGPYIAHNLRASLAGQPLRRYVPQRDFLTLLNTGGGYAIGVKWGLTFQGEWVMRWKDRIDRKFMRRFQRKATERSN